MKRPSPSRNTLRFLRRPPSPPSSHLLLILCPLPDNHSPRPSPASDGSSLALLSQGRAALSLSNPNEALLLRLRLCRLCFFSCALAVVVDRSSSDADAALRSLSFQPPRPPPPARPASLRRFQSNRSDVRSDREPAARGEKERKERTRSFFLSLPLSRLPHRSTRSSSLHQRHTQPPRPPTLYLFLFLSTRFNSLSQPPKQTNRTPRSRPSTASSPNTSSPESAPCCRRSAPRSTISRKSPPRSLLPKTARPRASGPRSSSRSSA